MSGSVENAALELRTGGLAIVADEHGGTLVLGALFATGRVVEFIAREAHGPVCLALPAAGGGATVEPLSSSGTLPELDRRAAAARELAEAHAAGRPFAADPARLSPPSGEDGEGGATPAVAVERLDAAVRLAELAGLAGAALICPVRTGAGGAAKAGALASLGRRHDLPAVDAAAVLAYGPRQVRPRREPRRRPRALARAGRYAQRLAGAGAPGVPARLG